MTKNTSQEHGSALLELLVAALLAGIILSGLAKTISSAMRVLSLSRRSAAAIHTALEVQENLELAAENLDSHRFAILPVVHQAGAILFTDGTPNPVTLKNDGLAPHPNSDALSSLKLATLRARRVTAVTAGSGAEFIIASCPIFAPLPHDPHGGEALYLGATVDGFIELRLPYPLNPEKCEEGAFTQVPSMALPFDPRISPLQIIYLAPITQSYTIYLDQLGRLRYLGHAGAENIENQPLLEGLNQIKFEVRPLIAERIFTIAAEVSLPGSQFTLAAMNRLGRTPAWQVILN